MLRDFKFFGRNSGMSEEIENVPVNPKDSSSTQSNRDPSRAPFKTIQDPAHNLKPEQDVCFQNKIERTPSKTKGKGSESTLPLRTPDRHGAELLAKIRFGWAQKNEPSDTIYRFAQLGRAVAVGNGGFPSVTPRTTRTVGRANTTCSESNSTQSTPIKSVTKPPVSAIRSKADGSFNARLGSYTALYKGIPVSSGSSTIVNTVKVPHFDLKEDPSFWINHNVQVIIRVRPLNSMERNTQGYNRCLKQESARSLTWIGQPETRFTFDHVACETVDQEMLFRMAGLPMVENCLSGYNSCMFAYGQTGSGKTYTMLGEIEDLEVKPSLHRGMTPRLFEFLFARIQAEEESRRDENLIYNCKCSFLEIYNEQITDLLDPSSTNLLLREDVKKGVYVENLSEFEVQSVSDIIRLLTQGSANRRVAATNMNRESSRSHSVFTCVIESRWEKDSTTNFRFARLNLVDLAGSERQKTSGAEGERLKEAANINKSLSTLGHVIMILMDVARGKPKHVPYRDSKLTFLLQDSLGGNSKTMIIANVSPSICAASETLNTLKFAQRAKLIQNKAVVNEDSTGDVIALQNQIRLLKEELSALKHQNVSRSLSFSMASVGDIKQSLDFENEFEMVQQQRHNLLGCECKDAGMSNKQLKSLEATLAGALRREQMAVTFIKQLEAEIEQLNRLVRQREEDARSCKMMLRFREDKIKRMEMHVAGSIPADTYLKEENKALSQEIRLLQAKLDRNPEVTRFASENIKLVDQLRRYEEFYVKGEREILLDEVSTLCEQLLQFLERNSTERNPNYCMQSQKAPCSRKEDDCLNMELQHALNELEECRHNLNCCLEENAKLSREIDSLHAMLSNSSSSHKQEGWRNAMKDPFKGEAHTIPHMMMDLKQEPIIVKHTEEILNLLLEIDILKIVLKEERSLRGVMEEQITCLNQDLQMTKDRLLLTRKKLEDTKDELTETKSVIEALELQQILSINEMEEMRNHNLEFMRKQELEIMALKNQLSSKELRESSRLNHSETDNPVLQGKLNRMYESLEKAKKLNMLYQSDCAFKISNEEEMDEVRRQAEAETAEVIVCMQEELALLQQVVHDSHMKEIEMKETMQHLEAELKEVQEKLYITVDEKRRLSGELEEKDWQIRSLAEEWELLISEIEEILANGCEALVEASDQLNHISNSFPHKRIWISEQVGMVARKISEKELLIEQLSRCLEDASNKRNDMECMLRSLRSAALVISEAQQQECAEKDNKILLLKSQLSEKISALTKLEKEFKMAKDHIREVSKSALVAFVIVNRLSEVNLGYLDDLNCNDNKRNSALLMKLSTDIKNSVDCISWKEEKTGEITIKLITLEKKISDLQLQEEMMLQRSNDIGSQIVALMKELDLTTTQAMTSLLDQEKTLEEKIKTYGSQADFFIADWCSRDFESIIFASELEIMACQMSDMEKDFIKYSNFIENLKKELIFSQVQAELADQILRDKEVEVSLLRREVQQAEMEKQDLLLMLNQNFLRIKEMDEVKMAFEQNVELLKNVSCSNDAFEVELGTTKYTKGRLLDKVQAPESEYDKVIGDLLEKDVAFEFSPHQISVIDDQNKELQKVNCMLENSSCNLQNELNLRDGERTSMQNLRIENESLKNEVKKLKTENSLGLQTSDKENYFLQDFTSSLETSIDSLQMDMETETTKMINILDSQSVTIQELSFKCQDLQSYVDSANKLKEENSLLQNRMQQYENIMLSFEIVRSVDQVKTTEMMVSRLFGALKEESLKLAESMFQDISKNVERTSKFIEQFEFLECHAKELVADNLTLQEELSRKDVVIKGLLYDLSLMQESASNSKDQRDEIEKMMATLEELEDELAVKSSELSGAVSNCQILEVRLQDKSDVIKALELSLSKESESLHLLVSENQELRAHMEDALAEKSLAENELTERRKTIESLENGITEMSSALSQMNNSITTLKTDLNVLANERDQLQVQVFCLKERLEKAEAHAEEHEAIAQEAQQQVQMMTEQVRLHTLESKEKERELIKLKKQLNEFIEERQGWLQEMEQKQTDMVAAQSALEQLRQRDQLLGAENEMLKMESVNNKNKVLELEDENKKLSGQQNIQQRIHHHAKIKEENNKLKIQNEELGRKLRKSEEFFSRVKEELAGLHASIGGKPCIDFDEKQRLMIKMKEIEEEKVQLAQQLLGLCTNVLKAAGIATPISDVSPSLAEDALEQLKNRITSLEMEQQDLKFKNKIVNERIRLSELMPQTSPLNLRPDGNRRTSSPFPI